MMNGNWLGLDGQVVIVTGGASGIGKHVVDTLVKVGAKAVAVDLNVKTGDELDGAYCVQCNVTDPESVNQMVQAVLAKYGKIDALVNNAGINLPRLLVDVKGEKPAAYNEALAYTRGVKPEDLSTDYSKVIPIGRDGKLDEVGSLVAYLVSDQASYITGTTVNISGGKSRG